MFFMKKLLLILIFTLSSQTLTKADDIKDFEIEGVNIGDSLLKHYTKEEILNAKTTKFPNSKKFYIIHIKVDSENYDQLSYLVKNNDDNYKIEELSGDKFYYKPGDDNIEKKHLECLKQKELITKQFEEILLVAKKKNYVHKYKSVDDGKSISAITDFEFKDSSAIRIYCNKFTKETINKNFYFNGLSVSITPFKIFNFLNNEAYK